MWFSGTREESRQMGKRDAGMKTKSGVTLVLSSRYSFSSGLLPISVQLALARGDVKTGSSSRRRYEDRCARILIQVRA